MCEKCFNNKPSWNPIEKAICERCRQDVPKKLRDQWHKEDIERITGLKKTPEELVEAIKRLEQAWQKEDVERRKRALVERGDDDQK